MSADVLARLAELRIIPVVEIEDASQAVPLAATLADAGLPVIELTMRTPASLAAAGELGLPFVPGVVSPSDILAALSAGLRHVKFFPAGAHGGRATLTALSGPFAAAGVRFMPTGGVSPDNAAQYLGLPAVFAVVAVRLACFAVFVVCALVVVLACLRLSLFELPVLLVVAMFSFSTPLV